MYPHHSHTIYSTHSVTRVTVILRTYRSSAVVKITRVRFTLSDVNVHVSQLRTSSTEHSLLASLRRLSANVNRCFLSHIYTHHVTQPWHWPTITLNLVKMETRWQIWHWVKILSEITLLCVNVNRGNTRISYILELQSKSRFWCY